MFKRIIYENWQQIIPIIAFVLTFGVFIINCIYAIIMKKNHAEKLAMVVLDDGTQESKTNN